MKINYDQHDEADHAILMFENGSSYHINIELASLKESIVRYFNLRDIAEHDLNIE